jgi:divalent metal cation (Fe/Co/Zn/Cd) transporter
MAADVHIEVDRDLNIVNAQEISMQIENRLKEACGKNGHFLIHVKPCSDPENYSKDVSGANNRNEIMK